MDTPESPQQSPQSPEDERVLSDSELLGSVDDEADQTISDSEIVQGENDGMESEENPEPESRLIEDVQEDDEVIPDFVSDPEEDEPIRDSEQEDKSIFVMEDGEGVSDTRFNGEEEDEHKVIDTPLSPDIEPEQDSEVVQEKVYSEEEDDDKGKADEESETKKPSVMVREMKDDAASVSRELDEHELDYDEEVPEEPGVPPEEDEEEDEIKTEAEVEAERIKRKEKKPILPPSPTDDVSRKNEEGKGRARRDSLKDKRNDDDDGEIDEGEIDDDDLEEGEVKDPSDRKIRPRPICRFFMKGNCTWGMNCRFIHPGVNDKGNYSLITKPDPFSPNGAPPGGPHPLMPNNPWAGPAVEELPPPPPPAEPPVESAWERGLRHAKEVLKKATMRKEQEPDFEEKRFNVTIGEDEREFDKENEFFRERSYRIIRDEMDFRDPIYSDPYADPYYDYEMDTLWRGGQYENFRVQYTEAPLPYHYTDRERERDPRERHRDRERERDHRERERRQRERERERERLRRKDEWDRERVKRDDKERPRLRPPREAREKKDDEKLKGRTPLEPPPKPMEPPLKKDSVPAMRRPDEWKDPWRRSKSPRRRPNMGSPLRGRRRHRPSGSSVSLSNSSRSSSRSSSYTGSGSSRSRSRSSSFSSYTSHSSAHSSFSGSRSRSRSFSSSPSRSPAAPRNLKNRPDPPPGPKGVPLKTGAMPPPPRRDKPPMKKAPSPPPAGSQGRPPKPSTEPAKPLAKPPVNPRETPATGTSAAVPVVGRPAPPREAPKPPNPREGRRKERHIPRRRTVSGSVSGSGSSYSGSSSRSSSNSLSRSRSGSRKSRSLSVSSVSSVSSASSSSSSVRSADSDDMYADLASPVSSASSRSPSPGRIRKDRGVARDRPPHNRDKAKERPSKKEEGSREERRKIEQTGGPPQRGNPVPRPGPGNRGTHPSPGNAGPPTSYGGSGSHKDIKLTLLNKQADKGNRKRYLPSDKDRPVSPASKRMALSPDRGRDKRVPGRAPPSPRSERPKVQAARPIPTQGDRKRPMSPPPKSSGKAPVAPSSKSAAPGSTSTTGSGSSKPSNTLSRREELLKQLKAVEDAIARKRAKMPAK